MSSREIFNLVVYSNSTLPYVEDKTLKSSTRYRIDWDTLFQGRNKFYKNCIVRCHCVGRTVIAVDSVANGIGQISVVGLGYNRSWSPDTAGLVLSDVEVSEALPVTSGTGYYINASTLDSVVAPQISPPQGISSLTVRFTLATGAPMAEANLSHYTLALYFELTDPIEPVYVVDAPRR